MALDGLTSIHTDKTHVDSTVQSQNPTNFHCSKSYIHSKNITKIHLQY